MKICYFTDKPLLNDLIKETENMECETINEPHSEAVNEAITLDKPNILEETQTLSINKEEEMSDDITLNEWTDEQIRSPGN